MSFTYNSELNTSETYLDGENIEKEISCNIVIKGFKYFILGDGIEIETKDFATEVAETINS